VGLESLFGDWPFRTCVWGLVVGHYQPLADNQGIAPWLDQTGSPQSVQRTLGKPTSVSPASFSAALRDKSPRKGESCPWKRAACRHPKLAKASP